jgi:hypothetical protein
MTDKTSGYTVLDPVSGRRVPISELTGTAQSVPDTSGTDALIASLNEEPRLGDWLETYTGRKAYPMDPNVADICKEDVAHALSQIVRYNGHVRRFYSVAEHCCHLADWMIQQGHPFAWALTALIHDAPEAYIGDIIRPIKPALGTPWKSLEVQWDYTISQWAGVSFPWPDVVKEADTRILIDERNALMHVAQKNDWGGLAGYEPLGVTIRGWEPFEAKHNWLTRFDALSFQVHR